MGICGSSTAPPEAVFEQLPSPFTHNIDAILCKFPGTDSEVNYIFSGNRVVEYSTDSYKKNRVLTPPTEIWAHPVLSQLPSPFNNKIDAVITKFAGGSTEVNYIFSGSQVVEYTTWRNAGSRVKSPPKEICEHPEFKQLPAPFNKKIDGVISKFVGTDSEINYIFSGNQVIEYTTYKHAKSQVRTPAMPIRNHPVFSQLPAPFSEGIDAAIVKFAGSSRERIYIFSRNMVIEFTTWSHATERVRSPPVAL